MNINLPGITSLMTCLLSDEMIKFFTIPALEKQEEIKRPAVHGPPCIFDVLLEQTKGISQPYVLLHLPWSAQ